jgi:hypothetical protein
MRAVTSEIRGRSCVVVYDWPGQGPDHLPLPLRVVATVTDRANGGSRVEIRCEYRSRIPAITLICALFAITPLVVIGRSGWPALVFAGAGWTLWTLLDHDTRQGPTRTADPEAAYLMERVEAVVAGVRLERSEGRLPGDRAPAS